MKEIMFALILLTGAQAFAQNAAPTKDDAVNFIKKVYNENLRTPEGYLLKNRDVVLNDCFLKIITYTIFKENNDFYYKDTIVINLSKVIIQKSNSLADMQIVQLGNGAILKNQAYLQVSADHPQTNAKSSRVCHSIYVKTGNDSPPDRVALGNGVEYMYLYGEYIQDPVAFDDNQYGERLSKAYSFLIKACGGGQLKADPNSKF